MKGKRVYLVWFGIFIMWAIYRALNVTSSEWVDEIIMKPLIFLGPVLLVVKYREKKKISSLGLNPSARDFVLDVYLGIALGVLLALEGLLANFLKYGRLSFDPLNAISLAGGLWPFFLLNFITSISEEILGRGFLYQRLFNSTKKQFYSAFVSSSLFLILHFPLIFVRQDLTGTALLMYPVTIMLLGITNCYVFSLRKSLVLPIMIHTFWNMTVALYL